MSAETEAGSIIIKVIADTSKLEKGTATAKKELKSLDAATDSAAKGAAEFQTELDRTGDTAIQTGRDIDEYNDAANRSARASENAAENSGDLEDGFRKEGSAAQTAGNQTETAGDQISRTGEKAKKADSDILGLKSAADKLKGALSITALGGILIAGAKYMLDLQKTTVRTYQDFMTLKQNTEAATAALNKYNQAISNLHGADEKIEARAGEYMAKYFGNLDMSEGGYGQQLAEYAIQVSQRSGIDVADLLRQINKINSDYGLKEEDTLATLQQLVTLADQYQKAGTFEANLADTLSTLTNYDKLYHSSSAGVNMDYQEVIKLFTAWGQTYKTASEGSAVLQREYQNQQTEIATAVETLPDIKSELEAALSAEEKDEAAIQELITLYKDTEEKANATAGQLLAKLLSSTDLSDQELYTLIAGRDKDAVVDVMRAAQERAYIESMPGMGTNTFELQPRAGLDLWGDFWQEIGAKIASIWFDNSETGELKKQASRIINAMDELQQTGQISSQEYQNFIKQYNDLITSADNAYSTEAWTNLVTALEAATEEFKTDAEESRTNTGSISTKLDEVTSTLKDIKDAGGTVNNISVYIETPQLDTYAAQKTAEAIAAQQSKTKAGAY